VFYTGHNNLGRWAKRMRDGIRENEPWVRLCADAFAPSSMLHMN